jgi:hypothetical protein
METTGKNLKSVLVLLLAVFIIIPVIPGFQARVHAGGGAAFLGGMVAGHIVGGFVRRDRIKTAAAVESVSQPKTQTVYVQQAPAVTTSSQPAQAAKPSVEQRLKELDKLAAGGYITPEEYKAKKKAIIDSI